MKLWKYRKIVFNYLYSKTRDYNLSEELTSDVYYNLLTRNYNIREETEKSYLIGIALNALIDRSRKKKFESLDFIDEPIYRENFETNELEDLVVGVLGKDFELFKSYSLGEDYNSLSGKYGLSVVALRKKIQRIREKIKKDLGIIAYFE
jgi:DNA-directed RNA polymerase specialized sigma24 family protein